MRCWLFAMLAGCSFSTRVDNAPGDGDVEGIDAPSEGMSPQSCKATEIESMAAQNCVIRSDGEVWCWGLNEDGAIGVAPAGTCSSGKACARIPTKVNVPEAVVQLGMGDRHTCAMSATKTYCWGSNSNGQFGDNSTNNSTTPREIGLRAGSTAIRGGDFHTCALDNGGVYCSGRNQFGEIGDMSTTQRETPTAAGLTGSPTALGAGFHHTCAIVAGAVSCWGENTSAQVDTTGNTPVTSPRATGVVGATAVAGGVAHTCARLATGAMQCWGANGEGQLGVNDESAHTGPQTLGLTGVTQIAAGANHTCALAGTGVWCWGEGYTPGPTQINLSGLAAVAISAGSYHDCAILANGTVRCWGSNAYGQLGNNSTQNSATPVQAVVCP